MLVVTKSYFMASTTPLHHLRYEAAVKLFNIRTNLPFNKEEGKWIVPAMKTLQRLMSCKSLQKSSTLHENVNVSYMPNNFANLKSFLQVFVSLTITFP